MRKYALGIAVIILVAAFLRFFYIAQGFPHRLIVDERLNAEIVASMSSRDLNPKTFVDGGGFFYPLFLAHKAFTGIAHILKLPSCADATDSATWEGRFLTAFIALMTIVVFYGFVEEEYGSLLAIPAAFLLAVNPLHVALSRVVVSYMPLLLFSLLAVRCIFKIGKSQGPSAGKAYLISGLFIGCATAVKHFGFFLIFPYAVAHILAVRNGGRSNAKPFYAGLAVSLLVFLIFNPFIVLDFKGFLQNAGEISRMAVYSFPYAVEASRRGWVGFPLSLSYVLNGGLCFLAAGGLITALVRHKDRDILLVSFPLVFYGIFGSLKYSFVRFLLPLIPFMLILAVQFLSFLIDTAGKKIRRIRDGKAGILLAATLLISIPAVAENIRFARWISQEPTEYTAGEWVDANVPKGSVLLIDAIGKAPQAGFMFIDDTKFKVEKILWGQETDPAEFFGRKPIDYVIVNASRKRPSSMSEFYGYIDSNFLLVREIHPAIEGKHFGFDTPYNSFSPTLNPVIRIYANKILRQ